MTTRQCVICVDDKPLVEFTGKITRQCSHVRDVCRACVGSTVDLEVNVKGNATSIPCPHPGCAAVLSHDDVGREATKEVFVRFDENLLRGFLQMDPNFRWCAQAGCGNGQIVEGDIGRNVFMTCHNCRGRTCTFHRCAQHTDRSCDEYDQDEKRSEEVALLQYIEREGTIRCPKCNTGIERSGGCDHMTCRKEASGCGAEFCFRCQADYGGPEGIWQLGNHAHKPGCPHYRPPQ